MSTSAYAMYTLKQDAFDSLILSKTYPSCSTMLETLAKVATDNHEDGYVNKEHKGLFPARQQS